jgi:class 3 adenylate cyclase
MYYLLYPQIYIYNMKWINEFKFFESVENVDSSKRSDRLLSDAQRHYEENKSEDTSGPSPAMLFTDVVGSSKMWSEDPKTMDLQLNKHFELMDNLARKHGGFVVKTIGDAFMVYFNKDEKSLENAVDFAVEVTNTEKLRLRIGICSGKMISKNCKIQNVQLVDFFGDVVNTASRMESKVSEEGGIAFTSVDDVSEQIKSISKKYKKIVKIEGSNIPDLKGVKVPFAYKLRV